MPHLPLLVQAGVMFSALRTTLTRNARFVRYGSGMGRGAEGHAEYPAETVSKFWRMSAEATACGTFFAVWWRMSHSAEKQKVDKYYAMLKTEE